MKGCVFMKRLSGIFISACISVGILLTGCASQQATSGQQGTLPPQGTAPSQGTLPSQLVSGDSEFGAADSGSSSSAVQTTTSQAVQTATSAASSTVPTTTTPRTEEPVPSDRMFDMVTEDGNKCYPLGTEGFNLVVMYIGNETEYEYTFGSDYTLEKLSDSGEWVDVPFAENAAFDALGHIISDRFPKNNVYITLRDDFYAESLTAGIYRVVKTIYGEDIELFAEFELCDTSEPSVPVASADDVIIEIDNGGRDITTDTESISLKYTYVGENDGEICFGMEYSLRKWSNELGDWEDVKFSDNAAFIELGYCVSKEYPTNSTSVTLRDDFYAEPLTAGTYLIRKPILGDVIELTFEMKAVDNSGTTIDSESGVLTLHIDEIKPDGFVCSLPWPYPAVYTVECDTSLYTDYCVGDNIEVEYAPMYRLEEFVYRIIPIKISPSDFELQEGVAYKPVIYLYPEEKTDISVKLDYNGTLLVTDPEYGQGWNVTAYPDGRLYTSDSTEYHYLFWEGEQDYTLDTSEGFCVSGKNTAAFLDEKLSYLGLSNSEKAEFTEFWLPFMEKNSYNVIRFHSEDYTDNAELIISPEPDTVIRVFMSFTPSNEYVDIAPQQLEKAPERNGFTVVEWGGCVME